MLLYILLIVLISFTFLPNKTANTPVEPANIEVNNPTFVISPVLQGSFSARLLLEKLACSVSVAVVDLQVYLLLFLYGNCNCFSVIAPFLSTTTESYMISASL